MQDDHEKTPNWLMDCPRRVRQTLHDDDYDTLFRKDATVHATVHSKELDLTRHPIDDGTSCSIQDRVSNLDGAKKKTRLLVQLDVYKRIFLD